MQPDPGSREVRLRRDRDRRSSPGRGGPRAAPAAAAGRHHGVQRRHRRLQDAQGHGRGEGGAQGGRPGRPDHRRRRPARDLPRRRGRLPPLQVAAALGNPQAVTDAGIGAILGEAAVVGAALNVRIDLGSIEDCDYTATAAAEIDKIRRRPRRCARKSSRSRSPSSDHPLTNVHEREAMAAQIIDGKAIAEQVREEIKAQVREFAMRRQTRRRHRPGRRGRRRAVLPRPDREEHRHGGSNYYNDTPPGPCRRGRGPRPHRQAQRRRHVHGILRSCPWTVEVEQTRSSTRIAPEKDLDCVNPANIGHVLLGDQLFAPTTPSTCIEILDREGIELQGLDVTIVNHSNIVGKPSRCSAYNRNASVHVVHVFSKDVPAACREADVFLSPRRSRTWSRPTSSAPAPSSSTSRRSGRRQQVGFSSSRPSARSPVASRRSPAASARHQRHPAQERPRRLQGADGVGELRDRRRRRRAASPAAVPHRPAECGSLGVEGRPAAGAPGAPLAELQRGARTSS